MIIFKLIIAGILGMLTGIAMLLCRKLLPDPKGTRMRKRVLIISSIFAVILMISKAVTIESVVFTVVAQVAYIWFILLGFVDITAGLLWLFTLLYRKISGHPVDAGKRKFLGKLVIWPSLLATGYGGLYEYRHIEYTTVDVPTSVKRLQGLTMAQLSDVHIGLFFSPHRLAEVLSELVRRKTDMLMLTGDIFDDDTLNSKAIAIVNAFTPYFPYGVYFCWGNHEHYRDLKAIKAKLQHTNIKVLTNDSVELFSGTEPVYILGVDYVDSKDEHEPIRKAYLTEALAKVPPQAYKILLAHHPVFIDDAIAQKINLTLSGHTHGGQIAFMGKSLLPTYKYMMGLVKDGDYRGYVSRGAGSWFPYRLGCPPEITFFKFQQ